MEFDVEQFITTGDDGATQVNKEALSTELNKYIDSKVSKGVEAFKKNYEKPDAKLEGQIKELTLKYNKAECKSILAGDLFSDKERELYLDSFVGDDLAASQQKLTQLVEERKAVAEAQKQKLLNELKQGEPPIGSGVDDEGLVSNKQKESPFERAQRVKDYYKK